MNKNMSFSVSGQRIELTDAAMLVAGTVNEYTARFTFDESWDGYQRTAVFSCGDISREQLLTDDACRVPWEVLLPGAYLKVGVYGIKDGSRLPTIWTERRLYINPGAGPTQEAEDPSPTLVEQLLARMGDLAALKTEDKSSMVAAINEVWSSGGSGGASVTDAAINEDGHLIITLSTGETIDAGYAVGPAGAPGKDGQDGAPGKDGVAGTDGKDGIGIQSVEQTTTSTEDSGINIVTVTKSDGSSSTFQVRNGSKGSTGPAGADGAPGKDGLGVPAPTAEDAGKVPVVQGDGSYGLADRIAPPATAQVGQTIVVKAVDDSGRPTAWEAADMPSGGGGSGAGPYKFIQTVTIPDGEEVSIVEITIPAKTRKLYVLGSTNTTSMFGTTVRTQIKNGNVVLAAINIDKNMYHRNALFSAELYDDVQFMSFSSANISSGFDGPYPGNISFNDYASYFSKENNFLQITIKSGSSKNQYFAAGCTFDLYAACEE